MVKLIALVVVIACGLSLGSKYVKPLTDSVAKVSTVLKVK